MTTWMKRSDWTDTKSGCATKLNPSLVKGVAIHYVGGNIPTDVAAGKRAAVASFLRGVRSSQMASTKYDYCDVEYSVAVDAAGRVWPLRGLQLRSGANGTSAANETHVAIFVIVGLTTNAKPTRAQKAAIRDAIRRVRNLYPGADAIRKHGDFVATACPGAPLRHLIDSGDLDPSSGAIRRRLRKITKAIDEAKEKIKLWVQRLENRRDNRDALRKKL